GVHGRMFDGAGRSREPGAGSRRRLGRSALDVAENVLLGYATGVAAPGYARDVDAVLGCDLANERSRFRPQALLGRQDPRPPAAVPIAALHDRGGSLWRLCLGRGRRLRRFGFWSRGGSGRRCNCRLRGCRTGLSFQHRDERLHRNGLPFLNLDLRQGAGRGRGDLGIDLVGRDLEQRLITFDDVADLLEPLAQGAFGNRFAHLGHQDINACHDSPQYFASHRAAFTISSVWGSTKSSSVGAYGNGTSCAVTRMIGPSSHSNACSLIRAAISPAIPPVRVSWCTMSTLFVFLTVFTMAASSSGSSVRRSTTSTDNPSSLSSFSAASSDFHSVAP